MGEGQVEERQLDALVAHAETELGTDSEQWASWPGGWPGQIGTALVDAVFSARATYKTRRGRGVHAHVTAWQAAAGDATTSLVELRSQIAAATPQSWARSFGNEQHSPSRPEDAPGGPTKAAAVLQAATLLASASPPVDEASDVTEENAAEVRRLLRQVPGIGYATSNYFLMLLGLPGVKPDRMVHRFISDAMKNAGEPSRFSDAAAEALVNAAARRLGVQCYELEHAIWKSESDRAAGAS